MGFKFSTDYNLYMTEDGPRILINTPYTLENGAITLSPVSMTLSVGLSRTQVIRYMKELHYKVSTIVSHEPIFNPVLERSLALGLISMEDLELSQRVTDGPEWYLDEFGLPVFSYSFLGETSTFTDKRYEP